MIPVVGWALRFRSVVLAVWRLLRGWDAVRGDGCGGGAFVQSLPKIIPMAASLNEL